MNEQQQYQLPIYVKFRNKCEKQVNNSDIYHNVSETSKIKSKVHVLELHIIYDKDDKYEKGMINIKLHIVAPQLVVCRGGCRKIQIKARDARNAIDLNEWLVPRGKFVLLLSFIVYTCMIFVHVKYYLVTF